jgi:hypothetical protein
MKFFSRMKAVLAVAGIAGAVAICLVGTTEEALASNMGFKENKQVFLKAPPLPRGRNLVALPANNPYTNMQGVCDALNLPGGGPTITQVDPNTGSSFNYFCVPGAASTTGPALIDLLGVEVNNLAADASGIIVGSHRPGVNYTLWEQQVPSPKGRNLYSVPFHTTNANMQDVCIDWGLNLAPFVGNSTITKVKADPPASATTYFCTPGGPNPAAPALVLGEAVIILYTDLTPAVITKTAIPSHF